MIKCILLDLDGTVYISGKLIDGAKQAIQQLREQANIMFLTNNSSVSCLTYLKKLNNLGLNATINEIYSSSLATICYLKQNNLDKDVYLVATEDTTQEFEQNNIHLIKEHELHTKRASTVVLTFDTELNYTKLKTACRLINQKANYIATHPDFVCPSVHGDLPDCGSFMALIKACTGREPDIVCGKPNKQMAQGVLSLGYKNNEVMMVGDRLYTDIKFALNNNFFSTLVLSGETTLNAYNQSKIKANFVLNSIADLPKIIQNNPNLLEKNRKK